jgi:uncharacterized protein
MAAPSEITKLDVVLTAGCNLRCSYCYQNDKKPRTIEWNTLRASADLALGSRRRDVSMLFIGGEPLLEFPLIRRAVEYIEARRRSDQNINYQIVTNGTLVDDEHLAFFADHAFDVQLSFDGIQAAQTFRSKDSFQILDRLLTRLREDWPEFYASNLSVSITLIVPAIRYLADSIAYFLRKQVHEIAISPAVTFQPGWRSDVLADLEAQFSRVFDLSVEHYDRTGEVPLVLFRRDQDDSQHQPTTMSLCGVGRGETPAVDVDGQVHGCLMFADSYQVFPTTFLRSRLEAMRMGDVRSPSLADRMAAYPAAAAAAGIFHGRQNKYSSYGRCRDCRFMAECAVCPVSIGHQPDNTDPDRIPDFLCAYNLVSLKYRDRFPRQPDLVDILKGAPKIPGLMQDLADFSRRLEEGYGD